MDARPNVRSDAIAVAASSKLEHKLLLSSGSTNPVHVQGRRVNLGPPHQNIAPVKISAPGHAGVEARQIDRMAGAQGIEHIIGQTNHPANRNCTPELRVHVRLGLGGGNS